MGPILSEMQIDDPLEAAMARVDADESMTGRVISTLEACAAAGMPLVNAASKLIGFVTHTRQENIEYLLEVVVSEVTRVRSQVEGLAKEHRHFIEQEFPKRLTEATARANETSSRPKIARMGIIVVHTTICQPTKASETVDEMLRVSVELTDEDVDILANIYSVQLRPLGQMNFFPNPNVANETWKQLEKLPQFKSPKIFGICAKLQSLGLIVQVQRIETVLGLESIPFALLVNGKEYIEAIRKAYTATIIG